MHLYLMVTKDGAPKAAFLRADDARAIVFVWQAVPDERINDFELRRIDVDLDSLPFSTLRLQ